MHLTRSQVAGTIALCIGFALHPNTSHANAINLANISFQNVGGSTADIEFDVSWSNSWHLSWSDDGGSTYVTNWDAAWIFAKYRTLGGLWRHATLSSSGHSAPAGATLHVASNGIGTNVGVFLRRPSSGSGSVQFNDVRLRWNFAADGLGGTNDVDVSVHAIEMVYIPSGAFSVGSGGEESDHFYRSPTHSDPYPIQSEGPIQIGSSVGNLNGGGLS